MKGGPSMGPGGDIRVIGCPHPLSTTRGRVDRIVSVGATIKEHAEALGWRDFVCAEAWVGDRRVAVAHWQEVIPQAGECLILRAIPMDGGGQDNGKTAIRIAALMAIVVAAAYTGGAAAPGLASAFGVTSEAGVAAIGAGITA